MASIEIDGVNGVIKSTVSDADLTIKGNDGGSEISALTLDMSDAGAATFNGTAIMDGNSWHKTNKIAYFGDGNNLQISSDGTHGKIAESGGSGNLVLSGQTIRLEKSDGEIMLEATNDAGVDIRHNNVKKLETTSTGIDITGGFTATAASTITTADNTDTLSLVSTDTDSAIGPNLNLYRNAGNGADADNLATVAFAGNDDAGNATDYSRITAQIDDASNGSEDVYVDFRTLVAGTERKRISLYKAETIFNEDSQDLDFRVESNDRTSMLNVDAALNKVGIGDVPDLGMLHVKVADSGGSADANSDTLVLEESGSGGITILSGSSNNGNIYFGDGDSNNRGIIEYKHGDNDFNFYTNATHRLCIKAGGSFGFGRATGEVQQNAHAHFYGGEHSYFAYKFETQQTATNVYNMWLYNNYAGNSASEEFLRGQDPSATRFFIGTNGAFYGNGTYGTVSDERIKEDITDANSQWDDIKALKVRNYKKKANVRADGDDALVEIGLIAQEAELVSPKLIEETLPDNAAIISNSTFGTLYTEEDDLPSGVKVGDVKDTNEKVKAIKYSVLYMKAIKALQEAQTRIETLETKVKALEDA